MMEVMSYEKTTNCSSGMSRGWSHRICSGIFNTETGKDEIPTEISQTSSIVEPTEKKTPQKTTEKVDSETKMGQEESAAGQQGKSAAHGKTTAFCP